MYRCQEEVVVLKRKLDKYKSREWIASSDEVLLEEIKMYKVRTLFPSLSHYQSFYTSLISHRCSVVSKTIQNISKVLIDGFLNTKDFNPLIWDKYFALCKDFITLPCLQLERYSMYRTRLYQLQ